MGSLHKVWLNVPEDVTAEKLKDAFRRFFGAEWRDVLDAAAKSFGYNAPNNGYFAVRNLRALENVTLDQVLKEKGIGSPPNVIVS